MSLPSSNRPIQPASQLLHLTAKQYCLESNLALIADNLKIRPSKLECISEELNRQCLCRFQAQQLYSQTHFPELTLQNSVPRQYLIPKLVALPLLPGKGLTLLISLYALVII